MGPEIKIIRLEHGQALDGQALELPSYETDGSAGMDIRAAVPKDEPLIIQPTARALLPTGLIFEIPQGYEVQIRPRSGLAFKHGITCLNTPGTIDSDYRGEIKVLLINLGEEPFEITRGMRIAQIIVAPVVQANLKEVSSLSSTDRGTGGFGSTGTG